MDKNLLADANGITSKSEVLSEGQVLTIPNTNINVHNTADTFKPYNPNELLENIQPTLPSPTKPE